MEAIIAKDFDENKISYGYLKKVSLGSVVNVYYEKSQLTLQTPLMNTFGLSEYEGKWSMSLVFSETNGVNGDDLNMFRGVLARLREKIISDIVKKKYYEEWLGVRDKWDRHSEAMKIELVTSKVGKDFVAHSKKDTDRKYPPTMNLKVMKDKETDDFRLSIYKLINEVDLEMDATGEPLDFGKDALELLHFSNMEGVRIRPPVYCLFTINIWIVNSNIYITPTCTQVCMAPTKILIRKAVFNRQGFKHYDEFAKLHEEDPPTAARSGSSPTKANGELDENQIPDNFLDEFEEEDEPQKIVESRPKKPRAESAPAEHAA
jgi:hypothetical protein